MKITKKDREVLHSHKSHAEQDRNRYIVALSLTKGELMALNRGLAEAVGAREEALGTSGCLEDVSVYVDNAISKLSDPELLLTTDSIKDVLEYAREEFKE